VGCAALGLGKPTEMSLRDLLVEELKRRGVVVVPEVSFRTVDGRRLMPDLVLRNGAQYVVETKLGAETKLLDAMVQLYDYSKHIGDAKGAFAVLFPEARAHKTPQKEAPNQLQSEHKQIIPKFYRWWCFC